MPKPLAESTTLTATTASSSGGVLEVEFMTPGWGSSGYYSREVVEAAAPLFAVGTHMYLDHPTETENAERPVRSVKDLAAVIIEAGMVNPATGGVRGKVKPFGPYRDLLLDEDFAKNIGVSIRGSASDITAGEAEGRRGGIVEQLVGITSVDFVTRAGRGGRVLQVLESAAIAEARNVGQYVESAIHRDFTNLTDSMAGEGNLTRDERIGLSSAIGDALAAFVASLESNQPQLYTRDIYVAPDNVPVTRPGSNTTTEESQEDTMPNIEITEAEHGRLVAEAGRVQSLEERATTAEARATTAEETLAERDRSDRARDLIRTNESRTSAGVTFTTLEERGLLAGLPLTEAGALDEAAFTTSVNAAVTERAQGTGGVRGFGGTDLSEAQSVEDFENAFYGSKGA